MELWNWKISSCLRKGNGIGIEMFCKSGIDIGIEDREIENGKFRKNGVRIEIGIKLEFEQTCCQYIGMKEFRDSLISYKYMKYL